MRHIPFRRVLMTLAFFAVLCLVVLFMDRRALLDPVRDGVGEVLEPVVSRLETALQPPPSDSAVAIQLATAEAERDQLRAENAQLKGQLDELSVLQQQQQAEQAFPNNNYLAARVIGHDPSGTRQMLIINKGSDDGLRVGMAVADPNYFVGQIVKVEPHKASVLLISDPTSAVGGMINGTTADGVIYGDPAGGSQLTMTHVNKNTEVAQDTWIVTSNLSESTTAQVPPYIPIGYVVGEPFLNEQTDELQVTLQPGADLQHLVTVWIVVPND